MGVYDNKEARLFGETPFGTVLWVLFPLDLWTSESSLTDTLTEGKFNFWFLLNSTPRFTTLGHSPSVQFYCCGCVGWFVCSCSCSIIEYSNDFRARNVSVHLTVHTLEQRVGWLDIDTDKLFQSKPGRHFNGKNVTCVNPKRKRKKFQVFIFLADQVTNDFISVECRNVSISVSLVFFFLFFFCDRNKWPCCWPCGKLRISTPKST